MKTYDELQAEIIRLRGELAAARAYITALEQAAAAMTAKRRRTESAVPVVRFACVRLLC